MSRSNIASTSKNSTRVPSKSAWVQGTAQPSSVSEKNPANVHTTHPQRSQGVSVKDGVKVPRSALKQGSAVTFGSIYDSSAPVPSSPAPASAMRSAGGAKSFGSVSTQNVVSDPANIAVTSPPPLLASTSSSHSAAFSASTLSAVPKLDKKSTAEFFAGPSAQPIPTHSHEAASPVLRSALSPSQHNHGQPHLHPILSGAPRQGQNGNLSAPPPSPIYSRPMANGQNGGVGVSGRSQAGSGGTSAGPTPAPMPSPRLTPHSPPSPPGGLLPPQPMWPGYYYHPQLVPPPDQFYPPQWPGQLIPQHQPPSPRHPPDASPPTVAPPRSPRISPIPQQQGGRKLNEEAERAEKERKEAEEWAAKEEAELNEAMEREKERLRLGERRAQREAEENVRRLKAQQDRLRKQEEDAKRATEERHRAEEEALRAAEAGEATVTFADMTSVVIPKKSEIRGEVVAVEAHGGAHR
ncbi:hypothetical protein V8E53_011464 [Lactarius tabidus]